MKISLVDVMMAIPSKINVYPNKYKDGIIDQNYIIDLAAAKKWNECVDVMMANMSKLIKQNESCINKSFCCPDND